MKLDIHNFCILIVDDVPENIQFLGTILKHTGYKVCFAKNGHQALDITRKVHPHLILLDVIMPELDGFETCKELKLSPQTKNIPVIFLTASVEEEDVTKGFELGAVSYLRKPFIIPELLTQIHTQFILYQRENTLKHLLQLSQELFIQAYNNVSGELLGESKAIRELHKTIDQYAENNDPVLILGPTGNSEEAIARSIHKNSSRSEGLFVYIDCLQFTAEKSEKILEKLHQANGGTLYFERLEQLTEKNQQQLLQQIESQENSFDSRIIAYVADVKKLDQKLSILLTKNIVHSPLLRERREDLLIITEYYIKQHAQKLGKNIDRLSKHSLEKLQQYTWPGNLRELQNIIEGALIIATDNPLHIEQNLL